MSAFGFGWRGLAGAVRSRDMAPRESAPLAASHPGVRGSEVPGIPPGSEAGDRRQHKLMSRAARLGAVAIKQALADAGWEEPRDGIGCFLGVGASGGSMSELEAMLGASIDAGGFSLARFGTDGLAACNPLFAFQLMNNFTLCHGAILAGVGGPNGAFYSRGAGTVSALSEAIEAVATGDCDRALAGGADSAMHPVTWAELVRDGQAAYGLVPGEGAALLALAADGQTGLAVIERCEVASGRSRKVDEVVLAARHAAPGPVDLVVVAPWGEPPRASLLAAIRAHVSGAEVLDVSLALGDSLAAAPALAWVAALDRLAAGAARRALVLSAGTDGDLGAVTMARRA